MARGLELNLSNNVMWELLPGEANSGINESISPDVGIGVQMPVVHIRCLKQHGAYVGLSNPAIYQVP